MWLHSSVFAKKIFGGFLQSFTPYCSDTERRDRPFRENPTVTGEKSLKRPFAIPRDAMKTLFIRISFSFVLPFALLTSGPMLAQTTDFKVGDTVDAIFTTGNGTRPRSSSVKGATALAAITRCWPWRERIPGLSTQNRGTCVLIR